MRLPPTKLTGWGFIPHKARRYEPPPQYAYHNIVPGTENLEPPVGVSAHSPRDEVQGSRVQGQGSSIFRESECQLSYHSTDSVA